MVVNPSATIVSALLCHGTPYSARALRKIVFKLVKVHICQRPLFGLAYLASEGRSPTVQVAVWDHQKVQERTVWRLNKAITNNLAFLPGGDGMSCCSSAADGTIKVIEAQFKHFSSTVLRF